LARPFGAAIQSAKAVREANPDNPLKAWTDCVRVVLREIPLLPPKYDNGAFRVVYEALLAGKPSQRNTAPAQPKPTKSNPTKSAHWVWSPAAISCI
jgi:hypothetical protein